MARRALLMLLLCVPAAVYSARSAKDWAKLDVDKADEDLRRGDDAEELRTESEEFERKLEARRAAGAPELDLDALGSMSPSEIKAKLSHQKSDAGMAMIFVTLDVAFEGAAWTEAQETAEAARLQALLQSGGTKVSIYRIDPRRLLVTQQLGWYGDDVKDFLLAQPTVMKVTWDSIDYENAAVAQVETVEELAAAEKREAQKRRKGAADAAKAARAALEAQISAAEAAGDDNALAGLLERRQTGFPRKKKKKKKAAADL
ncbi:hypothetical protein M885DRAFT_618816 [Pelagophyceae sp. CCMP2097]|nr:hypothetical protein M885DRAFT_618816 [Pelagophyceae sp. CCMP2097]|mmetsp:Transcript_6656/g.23787  ORF Transcript_6656/g.23787 Transcript_6656/m.23787 type:complete len:259 (+) Transcript_6656:3067-3843(+)